MDTGDRLYKRVQSTMHSPSLSVEGKKERLKKDFVYSLGGLPVGMLDELFEVVFFSQPPLRMSCCSKQRSSRILQSCCWNPLMTVAILLVGNNGDRWGKL